MKKKPEKIQKVKYIKMFGGIRKLNFNPKLTKLDKTKAKRKWFHIPIFPSYKESFKRDFYFKMYCLRVIRRPKFSKYNREIDDIRLFKKY